MMGGTASQDGPGRNRHGRDVDSTTARPASVAEFYKGRTVSVIIGYSAGTGYDIYARLLARFIGRYIPGNPTVIAQNMPGGGQPQGRDVCRRASLRRTAA